MRTVRFEVAYDGTRFHGWQRQDGFDSVQQALEEGLAALLDGVVTVHGAGRTDTGVHGLRQVAHAQVATRLDDDRLRHALNAHVGEGVVVNRLETCRADFHARFDARGKRYLYRVQTARFRPPIGPGYAHFVRDPLDLEAMRAAAAKGYSTATDLADWLVRELGLPFREAHHVTGRIVALAEEKGSELAGVSLADMQKVHSAITKDVFNVLTVEASASSRTSYGGTSPVRVQEQVAQWTQRLRLE